MDEPGLFADRVFDAAKVKAAVVMQIDLTVGDAVFRKGTGGGTNADDLLQRIVRLSGNGKQLVARKQVRAQRDGKRMGAAGDLRTDERSLGAERVGIDAL